MKKLFTLLTLLVALVTSAWGAAVGDLKTIANDYVFIADDFTANGTVKLTANTLYDGNVIFAPTANSVATNKGSVTFEGDSHLNSLRLKNTQDQLCFKVSAACTVTFYTQSHNSRGIQVGSEAGGTQYGSQTASTKEWSCDITSAGVVYLSSYGGDFYFAGFKVTFPKTGQPTLETNPVSAEYSQGDAATALSVSATAASSGALSYQWYKNTTNKSVLDAEGAEAIDGATNATYTPSTATAGTTYYFCKVTEEGNANVATTRIATVKVNPAGFSVTYSLGDVTGTVGTLPAGVDHVTSVTIPVNKTLYKEDCTLTAWNDGSADHAIGAVAPITANTTLTPVFTANGASSYLGHNASTATWQFQTGQGAPTWELEGFGTETKYYYVTQTSIGGNNIDLLMTIDATNGKLNNTKWTDWALINENTILTVPVIAGATLQLYVYAEGSTPVTFGGNAGTYDSNVYSYTATADGDLDIVIGNGQSYVKYLTVTYPSETAVLTVSANNTIVPLTKENINSVDYLAVTTNNWATDKTYGGYTGDFYNMSSTDRKLTIKVTGASTFEAFVRNDSGSETRSFKVKVGDADAVDISAESSTLKSTGVFAIADPSGETTITLSGGGSSVYPVYVNFNPAVTASFAAGKEYITFASSYALDCTTANLPAGLKAYKATGASASSVTIEEVNSTVNAGTGLLLQRTGDTSAAGNFDIPVVASGTNISATNKLVGVTAAAGAAIGGDGVYDYVLKDGKFYHASAGTLAQGKAYLHLDAEPAAPVLTIDFSGTTGINAVNGSEIKANGEYYNLNGQRVANPTKGLYIVNGKKVVLK